MALENKLGITNSAELAREEERISIMKSGKAGLPTHEVQNSDMR